MLVWVDRKIWYTFFIPKFSWIFKKDSNKNYCIIKNKTWYLDRLLNSKLHLESSHPKHQKWTVSKIGVHTENMQLLQQRPIVPRDMLSFRVSSSPFPLFPPQKKYYTFHKQAFTDSERNCLRTVIPVPAASTKNLRAKSAISCPTLES